MRNGFGLWIKALGGVDWWKNTRDENLVQLSRLRGAGSICTVVPELKNIQFVLFQVFNLSDFSELFLFYSSIRIRIRTFFRIRIRSKPSDSFGFGSTTFGRETDFLPEWERGGWTRAPPEWQTLRPADHVDSTGRRPLFSRERRKKKIYC
jgi:hypothetical protein